MNIPDTTHNQQEFTVSEVSQAIRRAVEDGFGYVRVRGEISGWRGPHSSGHAYFRLKDDKAVLEAVCWRGSLGKLKAKLEEGLEVIATGRITTYPGSSKYQIVVEQVEPAGAGALMALLEKRRAMLAAEGLFDESRKKPLPFLPQTIGVITSPTGVVIRDILHRIKDRFPVHVLVWPVAVQGENAAGQIAEAIEGFNALALRPSPLVPDLLIVARGGGSLEDLWAFNEEIVVRVAAASKIPLISAVGHETDTTLIDFVSDRRAPTPTAAAEMAVPVRAELQATLLEYAARAARGITRKLDHQREVILGLARGLPDPARLLEYVMQRLDDVSARLKNALPQYLVLRVQTLATLTAKLSPAMLAQSIDRHARDVSSFADRMHRMVQRNMSDREKHLAQVARLLDQMDFRVVLARGFALVRDGQGKLIASAKSFHDGPHSVVFHDGEVKVKRA